MPNQSPLDYRFNQQPLAQPANMAAQAMQSPQGQDYTLSDKLATREQKTADLINNYGLLRKFAIDMERKGIPYARPDFESEDGGEAYRLFLKLESNVRTAEQELKNEYEAEKDLRQPFAEGKVQFNPGVDPTKELAYSDPNSYYSTALTPGVAQANKSLGEDTNTMADQNRRNQLIQIEEQKIDQQVSQGLLSPERGQFMKAQLVPNTYTNKVFAPPRVSASGVARATNAQDRAELIRQVKSGILTGDNTPLNILKRVPGVQDVKYVNTGDKVGIELAFKGQPSTFIDLRSEKGGEGEINAVLNRIEGQLNVPNEDVFKFDTQVTIPESNADAVIAKARETLLANGGELMPKIQELARKGQLVTPENELIAALEPYENWRGTPKLRIKYYKPDKKGNPTSKISEKVVDMEDELDYINSLVDYNANDLATGLGAGFKTRLDLAVDAFVKKVGRNPTASELEKIKAKYK